MERGMICTTLFLTFSLKASSICSTDCFNFVLELNMLIEESIHTLTLLRGRQPLKSVSSMSESNDVSPHIIPQVIHCYGGHSK